MIGIDMQSRINWKFRRTRVHEGVWGMGEVYQIRIFIKGDFYLRNVRTIWCMFIPF